MKTAIAGLALTLLAACGGLVTPGSEEQPGGPGPSVPISGTASAGGASQVGSAAGASAITGAGVAPLQPPNGPGVSSGGGPSAPGGSADDSGSGPPATGTSAGSGSTSEPPAAGAGGSVSGGSGLPGGGGSVGVGFASSNGVSGSASCPPSNDAPACPALPAFVSTPDDVGTWQGCQYMACLGALCATCTCVASGVGSTWECAYGAQPVGNATPAPPTPPVLPTPPSPFMVPDAGAPPQPQRPR